MLTLGVRVVRGPNWAWQNQDGGEGYVGTVCEVGRPGRDSPDKTVVVQWDSGGRTNYRTGYQGQFDLRVIDNAQIGVKHQNIICDGCKKHGIAGMRFQCKRCTDYDLCSLCYHADKHDLTHPFQRFDSASAQGMELPIRKNATKCYLRGIFVGAIVVRGHDWEWGMQDGGEGKTGRVMDIQGWDNESARSVVNVKWSSGSINVYRLGHKGKCDLKFIQEASGGYYYRDHIPILGEQHEVSVTNRPVTINNKTVNTQFSVGDKVLVNVTVEELKALQQGHGGWNQRMAEYIGKKGTVHRVTVRGDIRVQHEGCNNRWTYNPAALTKITSFSVGDIVCVINDMERVKELQKGHGEWIDIMKNALGKLGKVIKVYGDGDLRIQLDGTAWTLNPACVRLLPGSATELSNTMQADQNQRTEPSMSWLPGSSGEGEPGVGSGLADRLVRDAAHGKLEAIKRTLETLIDTPGLSPDMRSGGRTALQVAAHQGHVAVAKLLLKYGADVNAADTDGDTTLHYAAFGNQPEIISLLLDSKANINALNKGLCSALHIAAHKQPAHCVNVLLSRGADVNLQDLYGDTALHDAIGKESNEVIEMLCNTPGIDFTVRNKRGFNVLHHASLKGINFATKTLLAKTRQLVNVKKDDGFSALHLAALNGHRDVVETLIRIGQADIDLRNNRNQTALLLAVSQGHCSVIELLINLQSNVNVQDEDGDTALHLVIIKRANLITEVQHSTSPAIYEIYEELQHVIENRLAVAIACYLVRVGCNWEILNSKSQTALDLLQDPIKCDIIKSYKRDPNNLINNTNNITNHSSTSTSATTTSSTTISVSNTDSNRQNEDILARETSSLTLNDEYGSNNKQILHHRRNTSEGLNVTVECSPIKQNLRRDKSTERSSSANGSRSNRTPNVSTTTTDERNNKHHSRENSAQRNNSDDPQPQQHPQSKKPVECQICSDLSEENVTLEPCGHKPACEDCVARLKKCLRCGTIVQKRVTKDGRVIPPQSKQPSAERMRYLECKVAEIEETHGCGICMERRRNIVFLCGHGACSRCANTLKICHMCRKTITKKIPIY